MAPPTPLLPALSGPPGGWHTPCRMSFMTVCSTTSSYVFSTRINLAKSSKISSWNRGSSCKVRRARGRGGRQGLEAEGPRIPPHPGAGQAGSGSQDQEGAVARG